jgi:hypothetical protein
LNQSWFIFLSSTAGSILAIIGGCGFVMAKTEKWYQKYRFKQGDKATNIKTKFQEVFGSFNFSSDIHQNTVQYTKQTLRDPQPFYKYGGSMSISDYDLKPDEIYIDYLEV